MCLLIPKCDLHYRIDNTKLGHKDKTDQLYFVINENGFICDDCQMTMANTYLQQSIIPSTDATAKRITPTTTAMAIVVVAASEFV